MADEIQRFYPERGAGMDADPNGSHVRHADHAAAVAAAEDKGRSEERERLEAFIDAVAFEVGCMEHYGVTKPGTLGKLAREMSAPLRRALTVLASLDSDQEGS